MAITPQKRKKMEDLIYKTFNALDKTGANTKHYKSIFGAMSDAQFDKFFKEFFANPTEYLILNVCDYQIDLKMPDIEDAAKVLGVPLFERVAFPHYTMDKKNVIVSKEAVPVGYCHVKRTQQTVAKKNGLSTTADARSSLTGQVTGADKNGRESDIENYMMVSMNMKDTLKELNGPRADDMHMKQQMYTAINTKGYVSLDDMDSEAENKTTLSTVDVYLLGMGLNSDLITRGLMTSKTLKEDA